MSPEFCWASRRTKESDRSMAAMEQIADHLLLN
jgi:hypothetical protein